MRYPPQGATAIGAYPAENETGWAAYDKHGRTWPVSERDAAEYETDRANRLEAAGKPQSPVTP